MDKETQTRLEWLIADCHYVAVHYSGGKIEMCEAFTQKYECIIGQLHIIGKVSSRLTSQSSAKVMFQGKLVFDCEATTDADYPDFHTETSLEARTYLPGEWETQIRRLRAQIPAREGKQFIFEFDD
ncbi:MAG TPA: hypothetical protein VJB94_05155 [Candidatus Nanoarchaeia archaeon]|nr:hypothetical protein [Candidatus Nanoarchaeia archaeon]